MTVLHSLGGPLAFAVICLLIFVEEAGLPLPFLPGDLILLTAGALASAYAGALFLFLPCAYLSAVGGALFCYHLSARLGRPAVLRHGARIHLTPARLARAEAWLGRAGARGVGVARVLPGTRINASLAAGCLGLPVRTFVAGVLPSTVIWLGAFTLAGFWLGDRVVMLLPWVDRGVVAGVVIVAIVTTVRWIRRRGRDQNPGAMDTARRAA